MSFTWETVAESLQRTAWLEAQKPPLPAGLREEQDSEGKYQRLDAGQRATLEWMSKRLPESGIVLADEVGTGKTRIACAVVHAVLDAGGRAAVVVPHGLMHQWAAESRKLRASSHPPKALTTFSESLREVSASDVSWKEFSPRPNAPEWWLISHGFRAPLVRGNSHVWRAALPAFVELHLAPRAKREDGRTRIGRIQHETNNARASLWGWNGMARIASDVAPRVRGRRDLCKYIESLPPLNVSSWNNDALLATFGNGGDGRPLTEELLGLWLGEFDLLVIDEAHKSRGEMDVEDTALGAISGPVLTRLVEVLLKQSESGRRLCLTATPMELELSQWLDVLKRARSSLDLEHVSRVVKRLRNATERAAVAPDEGSRLDELCAAARDFTNTLAPRVTRRRRDEAELIQEFCARLVDEKRRRGPHPHRNVRAIPVAWAEPVDKRSPWLDVLFAAESMSHAALGLKKDVFESALQLASATPFDEKKQKRLKHLVRDLYARIASGHLSADLFDADVRIVPPPDCDERTRGKLQRTEYWRKKIQRAMGSNLHEDEHPRIHAAVKEIENWTFKLEKPEKVLVFGVFLRPLHLLADVLNVRRALRDADQCRPSSLNFFPKTKREGDDQSKRARHLLDIAARQLERLRGEDALQGRLAAKNGADMRRALAESHKAYERLRRDVREQAKNSVIAWRTDCALFGGAPVDPKLEVALEDHLVSFVLDEFLAMSSKSDRVTGECFDALTNEFVKERLQPLLGELDDKDVDEEQAVLRQKALRSLLEDDDGRQSLHARLLQGATRWQTRRYLQAAFNRPGASPWVLIAQSQVGREGLNLHESCRVVVQFHSEWNPAVLEQQIGRVDRKGSRWEKLATEWMKRGAKGQPSFIEVRQLVFEGTYDAFQWDRVRRRQHVFDASLFGSLLSADAWERIPPDRLPDLLAAAPSFSPTEQRRNARPGAPKKPPRERPSALRSAPPFPPTA